VFPKLADGVWSPFLQPEIGHGGSVPTGRIATHVASITDVALLGGGGERQFLAVKMAVNAEAFYPCRQA
jgi:hypothetical protein